MRLRTIRLLLWLPLAAFLAILVLVWVGLVRPHDTTIRSRLVGKPVPAFALPRVDGAGLVGNGLLADGRPHLVNLFASWCVPCAAEAPQLAALQQMGIPIIGIATRDRPEDLAGFFARNGNPFAVVARDDTAAFQVSLGSSGVPETYVVDGKGVIRLQHIGDIRPDQVAEIAAAVRDAG